MHLRSKSNELDVEKVQPVAFTCGRKIGLPAGMAGHCGAKIIPRGSHRFSLVSSSRFSHPHPPYSPSRQAATPAKLREGPRQPLRTSRASHRTHTAAGESGAGFGRSGQAVSGKCGRVVAGSRSPHRYRVIVRGVRREYGKNPWIGVAGSISGGAVCAQLVGCGGTMVLTIVPKPEAVDQGVVEHSRHRSQLSEPTDLTLLVDVA